jgi:hypothetical protein
VFGLLWEMIGVFHVFDAGATAGHRSKLPDLVHERIIRAECGRPAACALLSLCLVQHRCLDGFRGLVASACFLATNHISRVSSFEWPSNYILQDMTAQFRNRLRRPCASMDLQRLHPRNIAIAVRVILMVLQPSSPSLVFFLE